MKTNIFLDCALVVTFLTMLLVIFAHFDADMERVQQQDRTGFELRRQQAAIKACGPGAASRWIDEHSVDCTKHNGKGKAVVVAGAL